MRDESKRKQHIILQLIPVAKPYRAIYTMSYCVFGTYVITEKFLLLDHGNSSNMADILDLLFIVSTFASALTAYFSIIKTGSSGKGTTFRRNCCYNQKVGGAEWYPKKK